MGLMVMESVCGVGCGMGEAHPENCFSFNIVGWKHISYEV